MIKIGVFYDGNYFLQVSNYYAYGHKRKNRLSISGLHEFIRHKVAEEEGDNVSKCHIVDSHYFRGRLSAHDASQRGDLLYWDRVFDDILMFEGVTTHYLPMKTLQDGQKLEKGVDVWMALEAYELAMFKKFDVVVLVTADGDFVPLIRKLNSLGCRVMVLAWEFEYASDSGHKMITKTSHNLLKEVTYPIAMHEIIDSQSNSQNYIINSLFVPTSANRNSERHEKPTSATHTQSDFIDDETPEGTEESSIMALKTGYGFIDYPPNNLFFHFSSLVNIEFSDLQVGDPISFDVHINEEGNEVALNVRLLE